MIALGDDSSNGTLERGDDDQVTGLAGQIHLEGVFLHSRKKHSKGHSSGFRGNLIDPETVLCTRWALVMEQEEAWYE
jgi:hypothetical protein